MAFLLSLSDLQVVIAALLTEGGSGRMTRKTRDPRRVPAESTRKRGGFCPLFKATAPRSGFDLKQAGGVVGGRLGRIASRLRPRRRGDDWGGSRIGLG